MDAAYSVVIVQISQQSYLNHFLNQTLGMDNLSMKSNSLFVNLVLIGTAMFAIFMAASEITNFNHTIWADRDLLRSNFNWDNIPGLGAEMNGTYMAQVPGGAYYIILRVLRLFGNDILDVKFAQFILLLISSSVLGYMIYKISGIRASLLFMAFMFSSAITAELTNQIWNPALSLSIVSLIVSTLLAAINGSRLGIILFAIAVTIGIQVHFSNITIGLAGIAVIISLGTRIRPYHLALILASIILLYMPYILNDFHNDLVNTRLILAGQGQSNINYPNIVNMLSILLGALGISDAKIPYIGTPLRIVAYFILSMSFTYGIFVIGTYLAQNKTNWYKARYYTTYENKAIISLLFIVTVIIILLSTNRNSTVYFRYATPLLVPFLAFVAICYARLLSWLEICRHYNYLLIMSILAAGYIGFVSFHNWKALRSKNLEPEMTINTIIDYSHDKLGPVDVNQRLSVFSKTGGLAQVYMDYIMLQKLPPKKENVDSSCIMLMPSQDQKEAESNFYNTASFLPGGPAKLESSKPFSDGWLITYKLSDNNCWKVVDNPYNPLPIEQKANKACRNMQSDGHTVDAQSNLTNIFIRQTMPSFRLCLAIVMTAIAGNKTMLTLISTQLRGYTGYPSDDMSIDKPKVILRTSEGGPIEINIIDGKIGGTGNPVRLPWNKELPIPLDRLSEITFRANYVTNTTGKGFDINYSIGLDKDNK